MLDLWNWNYISEMKGKITDVIWDWNGTIINDIELCTEIANWILEGHTGRQLSVSQYRSIFGFPIYDYYKKLGVDFEKESYENLTTKFISTYENRVDELVLHDGVFKVFQDLQSAGLQQHILTAAHIDMVHPKLELFGIKSFFNQVEGLDNHEAASKVDRGVAMLEKMNFDLDKTVMIGDTDHDLEVAEALGIHCVLIANGHQSKDRLLKIHKPTHVLNDVTELLELIL